MYEEAASENGLSQRQVDEIMSTYYGVSDYHVLEYIESGGIHHVDTWAKFLDEETVLVKEVWASHHTYSTLEQRATLLASLTASTGRNYQVHRVYCYDFDFGAPASYTNSIILNDHIYVPFFGDSAHDQAALEAYRQAAPGYTVTGYDYSGFLSDDALHCRTKGIMDGGMLRVGHVPLREAQEGAATVTATIVAHSGQPLTETAVHYRHDQGAWQGFAHDRPGRRPVRGGHSRPGRGHHLRVLHRRRRRLRAQRGHAAHPARRHLHLPPPEAGVGRGRTRGRAGASERPTIPTPSIPSPPSASS